MAAGAIRQFITHHYRHFNAAALKDAADGYSRAPRAAAARCCVTMAGAMSTAELGLSLAEMIRQDKVHAICCTGANLEEDIFNLVAHDHYERMPHYRDLTPQDEQALLDQHLNRVTDTCIPEEEAMRRIERAVLEQWKAADAHGRALLPARVHVPAAPLAARWSRATRSIPRDSWLLAACREEPADLRARAGRTRRSATSSRRTASPAT